MQNYPFKSIVLHYHYYCNNVHIMEFSVTVCEGGALYTAYKYSYIFMNQGSIKSFFT